jgi:hypothetical protein
MLDLRFSMFAGADGSSIEDRVSKTLGADAPPARPLRTRGGANAKG